MKARKVAAVLVKMVVAYNTKLGLSSRFEVNSDSPVIVKVKK